MLGHMKLRCCLPVTAVVLTIFLDASPRARGVTPVPAERQEEAARVQLVRGLLEKHEKFERTENILELHACDQELKRHPAPADGDAAKRLAGKWRSPRHDYLFRPDGTWTMLPAEKDTVHGRWRITGNQIEVTSGYDKPDSTARYTLILLTDKDCVYTDGENVFCETRLAR